MQKGKQKVTGTHRKIHQIFRENFIDLIFTLIKTDVIIRNGPILLPTIKHCFMVPKAGLLPAFAMFMFVTMEIFFSSSLEVTAI